MNSLVYSAVKDDGSIPTEGHDTAVLVQRMVSQIVLDLRFRGYANHDGDRDWVKEASAWDRIGARLFGLPVCPSCGRFDGRHDDDCACQPMSDADSDSFEQAAAATETVECDACEGSGKIVEEARLHGHNQHSACQRDCDDCDGTGRFPATTALESPSVGTKPEGRSHPNQPGETSRG